MDFLADIRHWEKTRVPQGGQVVVHCDDGCGRTGTLIALDTQLQRMQKYGSVNVVWNVMRLRKQRMGMVANPEQYAFIHRALSYAAQKSQDEYECAASP